MKYIVEVCKLNFSMNIKGEPVKLRLRGRGSGYREGPDTKESNESLHLCVSSKYFYVYNIACSLVTSLLLKIYDDFKKHNDMRGIYKLKIPIKRIEGNCAKPKNNSPKMVQLISSK